MARLILKTDSATYKKLEALEDYLQKHGINIQGIESIVIGGRSFEIKDRDASTSFPSLPRTFDTEQFYLIDSNNL